MKSFIRALSCIKRYGAAIYGVDEGERCHLLAVGDAVARGTEGSFIFMLRSEEELRTLLELFISLNET